MILFGLYFTFAVAQAFGQRKAEADVVYALNLRVKVSVKIPPDEDSTMEGEEPTTRSSMFAAARRVDTHAAVKTNEVEVHLRGRQGGEARGSIPPRHLTR